MRCLGRAVCLTVIWMSCARVAPAGAPPYPASTVITGIEWATTATQDALGSDKFPMTWADDGHLYTAFGDGWGFPNPEITTKLSMGWARIEGSPEAYVATNIRSGNETIGSGAAGKKGTGLLSIDGTLYLLVSNADNNGRECEIWKSADHGVSWTDSGWNFPLFSSCAWLNFGRDYAGARDGYVYMYAANTPDAYIETDDFILARAPVNNFFGGASAWTYYVGQAGGSPVWSANIAERGSVFHFAGGCNRLDVVRVPTINRYLLVARARNRAGTGNPNHFSIYDAPEPWGPWTTVYYTEASLAGMSAMDSSSGGWGESQRVPSKWISTDGRTIHLVYAGDDSFRVRRATLTIAGSSTCGNGVLEAGEICDGALLGGATCVTLGFGGGVLSCTECRHNTTACLPGIPGNLRRTDTGGGS